MIYQSVHAFTGLSEAEAAYKLKQEGYNELPSSQKRSFWAILWEVLQDPIFLLLVACGVIYLVLGDIHEAFMVVS